MTTTTADLVSLLHQRGPILAQLIGEPVDTATLTDMVEVSRRTVDRAVAAFEEWGLIVHDSGRIEPTLFARFVVTVYDDFEASVADMAAHEDSVSRWQTAGDRTDALKQVADRIDLLEYVQTPRDKRALVDELPYARSTVDRAVRELEIVGLVQWTTAGYTTTSIGQWITERYRALLATFTELLAARDLLVRIPANCVLPPALITEADIEQPDETTPYRLLAGVRDRLDTADRIRAVLPAVPNPQLLDVCHHRVVRHGATLEMIIDPSVTGILTSEFPGPLAEMTAAATGTFTAAVADTPPFGLVLADTAGDTTVSVLIDADHRSVAGAIHTDTDAAIEWAEDYYRHIQEQATETTTDWLNAATPTGDVALSAVADTGRVEREAEGFVRLTAEYFADRTAAPPATAWRAGFDLVDVHAGYTIDRERVHEGDSQFLTDHLIEHLAESTDHALIGPPGSGKSTVCKSIACRWYEQGRGTVFYRTSGRGTTFDSPAILSAHLRESEGHTLVVVEDAVRAEANTIFRVMDTFRGTQDVTFLLDARRGEWDDSTAFPIDARLDAYRTEAIETVAMPALDEEDCERLIEHFQTTCDHEVDVTASHLLREIDTTDTEYQHATAGDPATLLLVLHRLTLHANPLAGDDARTLTTLTEDIQRTIADLRAAGGLTLDVGVFVNLLNVTGIGVHPALVYALAADRDETDSGEAFETVHNALSALDGRIIFERGESEEDQYRVVHEAWSALFLDQLLAADEHEATRRFGQCVTALLALADDPDRRTRISAAVGGTAPPIGQIESVPSEWADTITERIFHLGLHQPRLAPLFGMTEYPTIVLPTACSSAMKPRCAAWRGRMYVDGGHIERATREFDYAIDLLENGDEKLSDQGLEVKAQSHKDRASVAWREGKLDTAAEYLAVALDSYRTIDDQLGEANCYSNQGILALDRGALDRAAAWYERALDSYREIGVKGKYQAKNLTHLGWIAVLRGDFDRAEEYLKRSTDIGQNLDGYFDQAIALGNLGEVTRQQGNLDRAEEYAKQEIDIARNAGFSPGTAYGFLGLGKVALDRGDLETATEYVQRSLDISEKIDNMRARAEGYRILGTIARQRNTADAEEHLMEAIACCRGDRYRYDKAKTLVELGELAHTRDSPETAREYFAESVDLFREMGAVRDTIETTERLATVCTRMGDQTVARAHRETARSLAQNTEYIEPSSVLKEQ